MKPRDYCCCAIPVMNAGIYVAIAEQFVLGLLVAILALATPSIVGASVPSFAKIILAIICFAACGVQVFGFIGEKAVMFRRYTTLHIMLTVAAFAVALTWIIISASKHNTAVNDCEKDFFPNATQTTDSTDLNEGETLCNIFTWVDVGLMGGLWVILAIMQFYLYTVISSYGTGQRRDHEKYRSLYSVNGVESGAIPLTNRSDPWDARPSFDDDERDGAGARVPLARDVGRGGHGRQDSSASVSTILAEKRQEEAPSIYSDHAGVGAGSGGYPPQRQGTYASTRQGSVNRNAPYGGGGFSYPSNAYTQDPQPTPQAFTGVGSSGYGGYGHGYGNNNNVERPGPTQAHPGTSD
ncbi:uncharacterized protein FOMMEDRAFT_161644 [Fomitiporia mediterranea MF3/22]|uniref:uncharacterized protein n=1 Tax=Fomitiporia mediterranea (strain MF3/22) TaxID=694068 RepID=UPI0004408C43|nr:uncharacterized protein FOMMEDRAFT_161644 [Fomitiporia mediterranea MF3/22]EJC98806.1 hypothetical protein FOMMEDRAFT_161644 [Fomitiporia mediterranea MF3/22]